MSEQGQAAAPGESWLRLHSGSREPPQPLGCPQPAMPLRHLGQQDFPLIRGKSCHALGHHRHCREGSEGPRGGL